MEIRLKEIREENAMTQEELALKSGVSRATIASMESGKAKVTTTSTMLKLAKALSVKVGDIFLM